MNSAFSNKKFIIDTDQAPRAIGPYSQAVSFGGLLFVSGQIPIDPQSGEIIAGGIEAQTRQVMNNLQGVLMAAGLDFSHVLKTTVFLRNMNDYKLMNDVYALYFDYSPPARAAVEVSRLPKDVLVEIECIAAAPTDYGARIGADEDAHIAESRSAATPAPEVVPAPGTDAEPEPSLLDDVSDVEPGDVEDLDAGGPIDQPSPARPSPPKLKLPPKSTPED